MHLVRFPDLQMHKLHIRVKNLVFILLQVCSHWLSPFIYHETLFELCMKLQVF